MAVPKRRVCHSRKKMRQSHQALKVPGMSVDRGTSSLHRPHHVDLRTGFYRGRQILFPSDGDEGAEGQPAGDKPTT
jgi:large subunit ribosomal protein L32